MVTKRSRKGCPECRGRKIKCDEQSPECGPCRKGKRRCHLQDAIFKQHGFSNQGARPSLGRARPVPSTPGGPDGRYAEPSSRTAASRGRFSSNRGFADRNQGQPSFEVPSASPAHTQLDLTSPIETERPSASSAADEQRIAEYSARTEGQLHFGGDDELALNGSENYAYLADHEGYSDLDATSRAGDRSNASLRDPTIESLKDSQEELFLLRHYSECIAPWMDLLYRYEVFSREVLILARQHPLLRYAACAVAAKQLGQKKSPLETMVRPMQAAIAAKLGRGGLGFAWYGIKYYEKAIQTLVKSITSQRSKQTHNSSIAVDPLSPEVSLLGGDLMVRAEGQDPIVRLLGTCILIQYEHLSANRDAWSGHLTGFSKLLDLVDDGKLLMPYPLFEQVYPWTKDVMEVKAGFWNVVANDLEESFVSHRKTRIDIHNLALWRNMGLLINDDQELTSADGPHSLSSTPEHARDKVLSYFLIRLLCILICYLAPEPTAASPESLGLTPDAHAAYDQATYIDIEHKFDSWITLISSSFHPDGTFVENEGGGETTEDDLFSHENWFSNDLCATTMLYYHMARMLLLIHRPPSLMQSASRRPTLDILQAFQDTQKKLRVHARQIIATVRGSTCDAIKLRAIQPLYVAGRCCSRSDERRKMVGMLAEIQDSLGIATGYRVKELSAEWGTSLQEFAVDERLTVDEMFG